MSEIISSGVTLTIPSEGDNNWASSIKDDCFEALSAHDHTGSGKGVQLGTSSIANLAITEAKLADSSVGYTKLASSAITGLALPAGLILPYGGSSAPTGYLLCDGAAVSRVTYSALFSAIGTSYGVGNGSTTFNLPNAKGRFLLGKADSGTGDALGATGGALDHAHTSPAHYHGLGTGATAAIDISHSHSASSVSGTVGGSDGTHNHTEDDCKASDSGTGPIDKIKLTGSGGTSSATVVESTGSGHDHSFSLTAAGQTLGTTNKTLSGTVGLVTGGVDGNAGMTTGANNPAFLTINYIIKT